MCAEMKQKEATVYQYKPTKTKSNLDVLSCWLDCGRIVRNRSYYTMDTQYVWTIVGKIVQKLAVKLESTFPKH